ncbi:MAG: late competence development ComFB family protein [Pseudohongiella sp.]|nr:late competence development ComFB family protein [Pseudohongiella sp.]MDP2283463.1 late competence development ComFB family protein [Pseudohongiella sp.]
MEGICNYYESLVFFCIQNKLKGLPEAHDEEYLADVACVALNQLPARYIRYIVDTRFFESEEDILKSDAAVEKATSFAIEFINSRRGQRPDGAPLPGTRMDSI